MDFEIQERGGREGRERVRRGKGWGEIERRREEKESVKESERKRERCTVLFCVGESVHRK